MGLSWSDTCECKFEGCTERSLWFVCFVFCSFVFASTFTCLPGKMKSNSITFSSDSKVRSVPSLLAMFRFLLFFFFFLCILFCACLFVSASWKNFNTPFSLMNPKSQKNNKANRPVLLELLPLPTSDKQGDGHTPKSHHLLPGVAAMR